MSGMLSPVAPTVPSSFPMPALYRFSVAQYHALNRAGILADGTSVELIEGVLVCKMTINPAHRFATQYLDDLLSRMLPPGWFVDDQAPLTTNTSEPEPDIAVIRGDRRQYLLQDRHPGPTDVALIVEVADSSLAVDQTTKARIYAGARIPIYWIVNLVERQVEVYSNPVGMPDVATYQSRVDYAPGSVLPVLLDGRPIGDVNVADLFA